MIILCIIAKRLIKKRVLGQFVYLFPVICLLKPQFILELFSEVIMTDNKTMTDSTKTIGLLKSALTELDRTGADSSVIQAIRGALESLSPSTRTPEVDRYHSDKAIGTMNKTYKQQKAECEKCSNTMVDCEKCKMKSEMEWWKQRIGTEDCKDCTLDNFCKECRYKKYCIESKWKKDTDEKRRWKQKTGCDDCTLYGYCDKCKFRIAQEKPCPWNKCEVMYEFFSGKRVVTRCCDSCASRIARVARETRPQWLKDAEYKSTWSAVNEGRSILPSR